MINQKRISIIIAIVLILQMIVIPVSAEAEPTGYPIRQLMVVGNKIVYEDEPSTMVRLVGTNIPSLGWSKDGKGEHLIESLVESLDGWNSNLIRLPVSPSMWFNETYGEVYKKNIDDMVKGAAIRGKYLLLDCHTYVMPTLEVLDFWLDVCDVYGNNPTVLFGLCNEPHDIKGQEEDAGKSQWALWRNGGKILYNSAVTQGVGHQQLVEAIRDKGAKNILVAAGLGWGHDLRGIVGLSSDGINYSLIDQGSNGDTLKTGYGIMYDSHIYPSKGLEPSWDTTTGCVRNFAPLLIGEFGWDSKDPNISNDTSVFNLWMPQLLDWIDDVNNKYGGVPANWTAWNLHMASTPRAITGWDFNPTSFLGKYLKERLLSYPPNSYPVTGEYANNFEPDVFRQYTTSVTKNSSISHSITNGALKITYNRLASAEVVEKRMAFPVDWVLDGVQTIELNIKANQEAVTTGTRLEVGFEGSDEELWTKTIPVTNTNDNRIVIPVNELRKLVMNARGDDILSNAIRGLYIGISNTSKGEVIIDNIAVKKSANPTIPMPAKAIRVPNQPNYLFDMESAMGMLTVSKNDNGPGSSQGDYFRSEVLAGEGFQGSTGLKVSYDRRMGIWGGFTVSKFPAGINCADAKYVSLMIKGDGQYQNLTPKIGTSTPMTIELEQGDTEWHQYTFKLDELGCELPEDIASIEFHANTKMEGVFWVDNIIVSDVKPTVFIKAKPIVFENGFEDTLLTVKMINNGDNKATGRIIDGGYNSQCAYNIDYQKSNNSSSATAEILHPSWNLSGTELFTFDAKSASGQTENITVGLLDKVGIASKLNRTFTLTNEWQRFVVPIEEFMLNDRAILTKRIKGLHIQSNNEASNSSILIDNLSFSNEVVEPPMPHSVQYKNTFDPDIYAANGGIYEFVGDNETAYIRATREAGKGFNGTGGLVFRMVGSNSGRSVHIKGGFPSDWDFSKAKYVSVMLKGTNVVASDGKMQNMNKIVMELWSDYQDTSGNLKTVKTGTVNLDATAGVWSNLIVPIEPNTKDKPSLNLIKGTNRLVIYSAMNQSGGFIMDDLAFHDMKPEEVIPLQPAEYRETFDANSMLNMSGGYYVNENNYVFRNDSGGKSHWGTRVQYEYPAGTQAPEAAKDYIQATLPLSWRLAQTTHFVCDSRIIGGWRTSDFSNIFAPKTTNITLSKVTVSLIDADGAEFKKVMQMTNTSWQSYALALNEFANKDGKELDLTKIKILRLYADEEKAGGQGGFDMDNIGFKNIVPNYNVSVSDITVMKEGQNLAVTGLSEGTATITANLTGLGKDVSLFGVLYKKSNGTVYLANGITKDISGDGTTTTLTIDIDIPNNAQDYQLKVFVWDRTYNTINPITGGVLEI